MRALLQSKIGVSVLCAVAAVSVAANFVKLQVHPALRAFARRTAVPAPPVYEPAMILPDPLQAASRLSSWKDLFPATQLTRDPFTFFSDRTAASADAVATPRFVLQAVSIEGDHALAVVNHQVVAVGERVGGFQVERIDPTSIQLRDRSTRLVVPIQRTRSVEKIASGKASSADQAAAIPGMSR